MTRAGAWWRRLALATLLLPGALRADWTVVDYDMRTDWVAFDFIGWVRVAQPAPAAPRAKGNAALQLAVVEPLAGGTGAGELTLEYNAPGPARTGEPAEPADGHDWRGDISRHTEYLVFLTRLANGAYWCDDLRAFPIEGGNVVGLPKTYEVVLGEGVTPAAREFLARARATVPGLRARVGRPLFTPPLAEGVRRLRTPQEDFDEIVRALAEGRPADADRLIYSPDRSSAKNVRALLVQPPTGPAGWEVRWQAVLGDKAVVLAGGAGSADQPGVVVQLIRRAGRWQLLNTQPESGPGKTMVGQLLAGDEFTILHVLFARDHPGLVKP